MIRSVRSYDARRTRKSNISRSVRKTRLVIREATARGRITVRTAEPIVPAIATAPTAISTMRAKTSIDPPLGEQPTRPLGSDEPGDVVWRVEELNPAAEAELADVRVPAGDHAKARATARAAVRAARRPVGIEAATPRPAPHGRLAHPVDDPTQHPAAGAHGQDQDDDAEDLRRMSGPKSEAGDGHQAQEKDPARPHNAAILARAHDGRNVRTGTSGVARPARTGPFGTLRRTCRRRLFPQEKAKEGGYEHQAEVAHRGGRARHGCVRRH